MLEFWIEYYRHSIIDKEYHNIPSGYIEVYFMGPPLYPKGHIHVAEYVVNQHGWDSPATYTRIE